MRIAALVVVVVAIAGACPPFDSLPFPAGEGEGGEGEGDASDGEGAGEGEGEGTCPAATQPTCTTAFASQLDDWIPTKLTQANDGGVTALAEDATTSPPTIIAANVDGELYRFDPSTTSPPSLIATCSGNTGGAGPVVARRIIVEGDGTLLASGTNGVCLVNGDGSSLFVTFLGDASSENALVPVNLSDDLLAISIVGSTFHFLHDTRTGTTLNFVAEIGTEPLPPGAGNVVDAIEDQSASGHGALVADEEGDIYFVDANLTSVKLVATLPAAAPSGVAFAQHFAGLDVALMTSSELDYGAFDLTSLETGTTPATALATTIAFAPARFTSAIDHVSAVAARVDGVRLDAGNFAYATYTSSADVDGPAPIGGCARVSALNDLAGLPCGTLWGVTSSGGVIAWDPDAARTAAVALSASAIGATHNFAPQQIVPLDDTHALLASGGGFSLLTRDTANRALVDVLDVNSGVPSAAGFALNAAALAGSAAAGANGATAVAIGVDGTTARAIAPYDPEPANTVVVVTGALGTDQINGPGDVVVVSDPGGAGDASAAFFAAGLSRARRRCCIAASISSGTRSRAARLSRSGSRVLRPSRRSGSRRRRSWSSPTSAPPYPPTAAPRCKSSGSATSARDRRRGSRKPAA